MNIFKKLFKREPPVIIEDTPKELAISDLVQFDDVRIKIGDNIYEGWVFNKIDNIINIVYTDKNNKLQEVSFIVDNKTTLTQNNITLLLNEKT